eukprot:3420901-Rhodomonas_salina.1
MSLQRQCPRRGAHLNFGEKKHDPAHHKEGKADGHPDADPRSEARVLPLVSREVSNRMADVERLRKQPGSAQLMVSRIVKAALQRGAEAVSRPAGQELPRPQSPLRSHPLHCRPAE